MKLDDVSLESSFVQFRGVYNQLVKRDPPRGQRKIKFALLSSFSLVGFKECFAVWGKKFGFDCEIYIGPYAQYSQEVYHKHSGLYEFGPDIIFFLLDGESLFGDFYKKPYFKSAKEKRNKVLELIDEVSNLLFQSAERSGSKIVINNLEIPTYSPMGVMENKQDFGFIEMLRDFNRRLEEGFKHSEQIYVFDYERFTSKYGKDNCTKPKMKYLADMKISIEIVPKLCYHYLPYIKSILGLNKKCIVLDLDNTLWGGILGEDGFDKIALGPTPKGSPFVDFQHGLLNLYNKGIILAVNSRNNFDDAMRVIREHPYMVLKEEHFADLQINWNDKISNMKEIAKNLNIGLDSMVFIDDDPVNVEMMRQFLPQVLTVSLPSDQSQYRKILENLLEFDTLQLTEVDKRRAKMYIEERHRREFKHSSENLESFLEGLKLEAKIEGAKKFNIPRIAQLTQRTNQFNLTTKRYQEEDIETFSTSNKHKMYTLSLRDRFGDYGLVGLMILEKENEKTWVIDTFLLSCRAMGRNAEYAFFSHVTKKIKERGASKLIGVYTPTKKNILVKNLYKKLSFTKAEESPERTVWLLDLENWKPMTPNYIRIMEK